MPQDDRTSSMLPAIARAITCFASFVFESLTESFIRLFLDVLSQDLALPTAASERSCFFLRPIKQLDFIGCAGKSEDSGAHARNSGWKLQRMERVANGRPGLAQ